MSNDCIRMPRTRIPIPKFPVDRCTWQTFESSERIVFLNKKLRVKHGLAYRHYSGEQEDYLCEDYSLFTEWEGALLNCCGQCMQNSTDFLLGSRCFG